MNNKVIHFEGVCKEYRLGAIGSGTLYRDLQTWWYKKRGREDPNQKLNAQAHSGHERFKALDNISFHVAQGETLGIIGHNGAGKSTLLKVLSRVTAPTKGRIIYTGRIASMLEVGTGFHPEMTGRENVYMNGAILGMTRIEITKKFDEIVTFAEIEQFIDTPVKRYSSGMYVKLAFAVAAHLDSEIMVMDEVLAVGDMMFQQKCLGKMGDASAHDGRTVLYVSHNMSTIRQLCDRVIVLERGKLRYDGGVEAGIAEYMKASHQRRRSKISLIDAPRASKPNGKVKFKEIEFLNTKELIYSNAEKIKIKLMYYSAINIESVFLRIMIRRADKLPIGTSETSIPFTSPGGIDNNIIVEISIPMIKNGLYILGMNLFQKNELGGQTLLDVIDDTASFEIRNNYDNSIWKYEYWGNIQLPNLIISKEDGLE